MMDGSIDRLESEEVADGSGGRARAEVHDDECWLKLG